MNLEDVCRKIESILNGTDAETIGETSPSNDSYFFRVFSEGVYLTELCDMESGKNFIPVVVGSLGGSHNPVKGLGQADYNVNVGMYFPVRFKSDFYALGEYLADVLVGASLTYGSQKAVSNISVTQFGELENVDMKQFQKWVENSYKMPIDVMEAYMSMSFTLFLATAKGYGQEGGFAYGNEWKTKISIAMPRVVDADGGAINPLSTSQTRITLANKPSSVSSVEVLYLKNAQGEETPAPSYQILGAQIEGGEAVITVMFASGSQGLTPRLRITYVDDEFFKDDDPKFTETIDASSSTPAAQQLLGDKCVKGTAANTSYTKTMPFYVKADGYYSDLIKAYLDRRIQDAVVTVTEGSDAVIGDAAYSARRYYVSSMSLSKAKGQLMSISLTLAEKA